VFEYLLLAKRAYGKLSCFNYVLDNEATKTQAFLVHWYIWEKDVNLCSDSQS